MRRFLRRLIHRRSCIHRSHLWRLRCLREAWYDHQCGKHNASCWNRHW